MSHIEKFWRDATAADVARVMAGEAVEARFRDCASYEWKCRALIGWSRGGESDDFVWASAGLVHYRHCQVYSPPQYWLDKPEPGEGYRLLAKFPDEALQPGDEAFEASGRWSTSYLVKSFGVQVEGIWYRRRIEQPKPEPKFKVGQRVKIIGPKERPAAHWDGCMDKHIGAVAEVASVSCMVGDKVFYDLRSIEQWSFRKDYLEPVEPKHYVLQVGDTVEFPDGWTVTAMGKGIFIK